ncbi:MAG: tRNA (N(6)-L-threonylcarbamoyladenosine(37)-C(2))-methylthiotransferase [Candidatus Undinarchaeales archaeon]|jgi:MiaB-like tRNA modifying enzyme|nr:tRNA (N(6)-L-threonylcarbamoyladenosine(37)-C(2))-methylthiotransferase [Candidatus Undinarchaeales archaeon]
MKFYIETYGCSRNQADSEAIAGALAEEHEQVLNANDADIVVVNTCIVKTPTENKILKALKKYSNKKLIVAGCMSVAQVELIKETVPNAEIWGVKHEDVLEGPRIRTNKIVSIIPISSGCLGDCTYCIVKKARGKLKSYSQEKIISAIEKSVADGCKEIWITAQDTGAYGIDTGTSLPALLEEICKVSGDFRVRVGMMNPNHAMKMLPALVKALQHEKMFKFLHLPVQSGNDKVLKEMNRFYTVADYKKIIEFVKKEIPQITISTDVIVGFPGETNEQFEESLKLVEQTEPDIVNISRYGARPGTPAAELEQHQEITKKERSRAMTILVRQIGQKQNNEWLDWEGEVLIDEIGKENDFIGRNFAYKPIVVKGKRELGEFVKIKVGKATENYLVS